MVPGVEQVPNGLASICDKKLRKTSTRRGNAAQGGEDRDEANAPL